MWLERSVLKKQLRMLIRSSSQKAIAALYQSRVTCATKRPAQSLTRRINTGRLTTPLSIPVHHRSAHYATLPHLRTLYFWSDSIVRTSCSLHCQQNIGINSLGEGCFPRHMGIYTLSGCKHTWTDPSWADDRATIHLPYIAYSDNDLWDIGRGRGPENVLPSLNFCSFRLRSRPSPLDFMLHTQTEGEETTAPRTRWSHDKVSTACVPWHTMAWKLCPSIWLLSAPNAHSSGSALSAPCLCYLPHSYALNTKYILKFFL